MKNNWLKKSLFYGILLMLVGSSMVTVTISTSTSNDSILADMTTTLEVSQWGTEYDHKEGDVYKYNEHDISMCEAVGGTDGAAYYKIPLDCPYGLENIIEIGILFADWGWWPGGDGPNAYIKKGSNWETLGTDIGDHDEFQWHWYERDHPDDYLFEGTYIWIKIYAEEDDWTIFRQVTIKYTPVPPPNDPVLEVTPDHYNFGKVEVGEDDFQDFTLENTGGSTATVHVYREGDSAFSVHSGGGNFDLGAGETHTITIRFAPTSDTSYSATIRIDGDSPCNSLSVPLSGQGHPLPFFILKSFIQYFNVNIFFMK